MAGYDPDVLLDKYYSADGDTPTDKINSLRREIYAKNKNAINAQKRDSPQLINQKISLGGLAQTR